MNPEFSRTTSPGHATGPARAVLALIFASGAAFGGADAISAAARSEILTIGDNEEQRRLRLKSKPVRPGDPGLEELLRRLERVAGKAHAGGLAAVQIGVPLRILLLKTRNGPYQALLNPIPLETSRHRTASWEYCLSVPWGYRLTERPSRIRVRYQRPGGGWTDATFADDEAVVLQHELEHLDGKLLSDHLNPDWFIPNAQIGDFDAKIWRECRGLAESACKARMKKRWNAYARSQRLSRR